MIKSGVLAAWVSNCVKWRMDYLRQLRKIVPLDSFGKCLQNNKSCAKAGANKCDRNELAGSYKFVFAFENTEESHYVTEKVYTGLRAGAVPIYKGGAPRPADDRPGSERARGVLDAAHVGIGARGAQRAGGPPRAHKARGGRRGRRRRWLRRALVAARQVGQRATQERVVREYSRVVVPAVHGQHRTCSTHDCDEASCMCRLKRWASACC